MRLWDRHNPHNRNSSIPKAITLFTNMWDIMMARPRACMEVSTFFFPGIMHFLSLMPLDMRLMEVYIMHAWACKMNNAVYGVSKTGCMTIEGCINYSLPYDTGEGSTISLSITSPHTVVFCVIIHIPFWDMTLPPPYTRVSFILYEYELEDWGSLTLSKE